MIWDLLQAALPSGLVALDFDGTLAPISPRPSDARPVAGAAQVLRDVRGTGARLAVVSGRSVASLLRVSGFGTIPGIVIYGSHGGERWHAGELRAAAAPPGLDELRLSLPGLLAAAGLGPLGGRDLPAGGGLWIEDKGLSLVIHARLTADPERVLETLRAPVGEAAGAAGLGVRPGKEVLEICIPGIDKGTTLRELIGDDPATAVYAGDDLGDLPAIGAVNAWAARSGRPALTVAVGPRDGPVAGPGRRDRAGPARSHVTAAADPRRGRVAAAGRDRGGRGRALTHRGRCYCSSVLGAIAAGSKSTNARAARRLTIEATMQL